MNIISENDFMRLKDKLVSSDIRLYPFAANHPLPVIGKFTGTIEKIFEPVTFGVVPDIKRGIGNLLGAKTSL